MTNPLSEEADERICAWVDGAMTLRERERFEAELRVSKSLRERADSYRRTVLAVRDGLAVADEPIDIADAVIARIRDGHKEPEPQLERRSVSLPAVPGAWLRSALVACAMIALILVLHQIEPRATQIDVASGDLPNAEREQDKADSMPGAPATSMKRKEAAQTDGGVGLPKTTVPKVVLRRSQAASRPSGAAGAPAEAAGNARLGGVDALFSDLAESVRSIGDVRLQPLPSLHGEAGGPLCYVAVGTDANLRAFLRNLSEAATAFGYEVSTGELRAAEVDARTPRSAANVPSQQQNKEPASAVEVRVVIEIERPSK